MSEAINCSNCTKKSRKATKFLVAPGGGHVPLCDSCARQAKVHAKKTLNKLKKSGVFNTLDPKMKTWLKSPEFTASSSEYVKQQAERDKGNFAVNEN